MYNNPYNFTPSNFMPQTPNYTPVIQNALQGQNTPQYVNGIESAKAYQVQPNQSVMLFDQNEPFMYVKTADASGFCTIKKFRLIDETNKEEHKYVTQEEFEKFKIELKNTIKKDEEV